MRCPFCGGEEDKVVDSRQMKDGKAIRRRRECLLCGRRFTTYEYVEQAPLFVVKKDGRREPFDRGKLLKGIMTACHKRPVPRARIEELVDEVERALEDLGTVEISTRVIGEEVMKRLKALDEVSYVRFASVYREFKDKLEFMEELKRLLEMETKNREG